MRGISQNALQHLPCAHHIVMRHMQRQASQNTEHFSRFHSGKCFLFFFFFFSNPLKTYRRIIKLAVQRPSADRKACVLFIPRRPFPPPVIPPVNNVTSLSQFFFIFFFFRSFQHQYPPPHLLIALTHPDPVVTASVFIRWGGNAAFVTLMAFLYIF